MSLGRRQAPAPSANSSLGKARATPAPASGISLTQHPKPRLVVVTGHLWPVITGVSRFKIVALSGDTTARILSAGSGLANAVSCRASVSSSVTCPAFVGSALPTSGDPAPGGGERDLRAPHD